MGTIRYAEILTSVGGTWNKLNTEFTIGPDLLWAGTMGPGMVLSSSSFVAFLRQKPSQIVAWWF